MCNASIKYLLMHIRVFIYYEQLFHIALFLLTDINNHLDLLYNLFLRPKYLFDSSNSVQYSK